MKSLSILLAALYVSGAAYAQAPRLIKDINPGSASGIQPGSSMCVNNSRIYFAATDQADNIEPWSSDGTAAGTSIIKDLLPGSSSNPENFFTFNNSVVFTTLVDQVYFCVYKTDGTAANTDTIYGPEYTYMFNPQGRIFNYHNEGYFCALMSSGISFMKIDANYNVAEVVPYKNTANQNVSIVNDKMYLDMGGLYESDGTAAGTHLFKSINVSECGQGNGNSFFFDGADNAYGSELWQSDGTPLGTTRFVDIFPGASGSSPHGFYKKDNLTYFFADDGVHGIEPWVTNGTRSGTHMIKDINPTGPGAASAEYVEINGTLLFIGETVMEGRELWVTDGTTAGTNMLMDINTGYAHGLDRISKENIINGYLYFGARDWNGLEPWVTDGTVANTHMVYDINPGAGSSLHDYPASVFKLMNGSIYLVADDGTTGYELWSLGAPVAVSSLQQTATQVSLYPNPTTGLVTIKGAGNVLQAEVYNAMGQLLLKNNTDNNTLNLQTYPDGIYQVKLKEQGKVVYTGKVVLAK
jgi:ELWxxDGT repeat protein